MTAKYPFVIFSVIVVSAITSAADKLPAAKNAAPFNLEKRELWTTNNIHGTPDPADPFTTQDAFPKLKFFEPLSAGLVPGSMDSSTDGAARLSGLRSHCHTAPAASAAINNNASTARNSHFMPLPRLRQKGADDNSRHV